MIQTPSPIPILIDDCHYSQVSIRYPRIQLFLHHH